MTRKVFFFVSIFLILGLTLFIKYILLELRIHHISCQVDNQQCPNEIIDSLKKLDGSSFLFSNLEAQVQQLDLNLYQLTSVTKTLPNTVNFTFSKEPSSYILNYQDKNYLVANNGLIQNLESESNLPLIKVKNEITPIVENQIDSELHQQNLLLLKSLADHQIEFQSIQIQTQSPQQIEIQLQNNLKAFLLTNDIETQIKKLAIILDKIDLKSIDLQIDAIDLRFKLPVLKHSSE